MYVTPKKVQSKMPPHPYSSADTCHAAPHPPTHTHTHSLSLSHTHIHQHTHTQTHTHAHTHTHTHTHTHGSTIIAASEREEKYQRKCNIYRVYVQSPLMNRDCAKRHVSLQKRRVWRRSYLVRPVAQQTHLHKMKQEAEERSSERHSDDKVAA